MYKVDLQEHDNIVSHLFGEDHLIKAVKRGDYPWDKTLSPRYILGSIEKFSSEVVNPASFTTATDIKIGNYLVVAEDKVWVDRRPVISIDNHFEEDLGF